MTTETYDLTTRAGRAAFAALGGARAAKKARVARPDIPRAGASERTGLTTLMLAGWHVESTDAVCYRLYDPDRGFDTGWQPTERAACDKAKEMQHAHPRSL